LQDKKDKPQNGDALIIIDVQNDFLPGGTLAVADGDRIIPVINQYIKIFSGKNLPIFATRDWHPQKHSSFKAFGGIWPAHCVAGTNGAAYPKELKLTAGVIVISKATEADREAYSGLDGTDLDMHLKKRGVHRVWVGGLATDYCVLESVKDFLTLGYEVKLLSDAVKAVNLAPQDGMRAEQEMIALGAQPVSKEDIL
jgi:nicotinamidase/pyrazinamidase